VHTKESQHILQRTTHNFKAKNRRVENKRSFKEQRTIWSFKEHRTKNEDGEDVYYAMKR
jgi:hypothetical protein